MKTFLFFFILFLLYSIPFTFQRESTRHFYAEWLSSVVVDFLFLCHMVLLYVYMILLVCHDSHASLCFLLPFLSFVWLFLWFFPIFFFSKIVIVKLFKDPPNLLFIHNPGKYNLHHHQLNVAYLVHVRLINSVVLFVQFICICINSSTTLKYHQKSYLSLNQI